MNAEPSAGAPRSPRGSLAPLPPPRGGLPPAGSRLELFLDATRRHGDVVCLSEQPPSYLISHPDHVKQVLLDNHLNYRQNFRKRILMGRHSLALSSDEAWRQRRRLMQPLFRPPRLALLAERMRRTTETMVGRWEEAAAGRQQLEVAGEMIRLTLDILIQSLLGAEAARGGKLRQAVTTAFDYFNQRTRQPRQLPVAIPTPRNLRLVRALADLRTAVRETVARRRLGGEPGDPAPASGGAAERAGEEGADLLSWLIAAHDEQTGEVMSDDQLQDELMMLLVMGHMTTAMAITWTWHLLARHPAVEERLRAELAAVLGGRLPEQGDLAQLSYTRQVLEETLRLYPPSWSFSRFVLGEDEIGGCRIPAGSVVVISPYVTHRREDLWERPERFDPDRFAPERAAARPRFAYYPFGAGPRVCIARDLAMMELPLILATVARSYRLRAVPGRRIAPATGITLQPRGGLPMLLEPAGQTGRAPERPATAAPIVAGKSAGAASSAVAAVAAAADPQLNNLAELPLLAARTEIALLHRTAAGYEPIAGSELLLRVWQLARALARLGIGAGDRVALWADNGPHWLLIDLAALAAGAVTVPLLPGLPVGEACRQLRESGAAVAFVEAGEGEDRLWRLLDRIDRGESSERRESGGRGGLVDPSPDLPILRHLVRIDPGWPPGSAPAATDTAAATPAASGPAAAGAAHATAGAARGARGISVLSLAALLAAQAGEATGDPGSSGGAAPAGGLAPGPAAEAAKAMAAAALTALAEGRQPDDPASLVFTPGTTGPPKPVLLTHRNLAANVLALAAALDVRPGDTAFSFLPLAHPYERVLNYLYLYRGAAIAYPGSPATVEEDLRLARPHLFSSVPAVWKRLLNGIFQRVQASAAWRRRLFHWAVLVGRAALPKRLEQRRPPGLLGLQLAAADRLVFDGIRRQLGGRLRFAVSGGARIPHGWITFLWAAGIPVFEGYGLTEAAPAVTLNRPQAVYPGSAGAPLPGVELRFAADGEILVRGAGVAHGGICSKGGDCGDGSHGGNCVGQIDAEGWLHTGDIGLLDEAGMLNVLGRREDLFTSPDGHTVAPLPLSGLLGSSHLIAQALVVGGGGAANVALLVPDFTALRETCRRRGIAASTHAEMAAHPEVREIYRRELAGFNQKLAPHDQIRAWELLTGEWSAEGGELTATGMVRRPAVLERHAEAIERLAAAAGRAADSIGGPGRA
ncbi:MAG TPA: cytochrome P450 [Thermoanaerobaculia bacterium]|nr:cytochrome P450 [Thermoanaerobaculia bacterium]